MAGSLQNFNYFTDAGTKYVIRLDESNGRIIGNELMTDALWYEGLPRNYKARYVIYRSDDGKTKRIIPVSKKTQTVPATIVVKSGTGGDVELGAPTVIAEKIRPYYRTDTGLNDGTDP